jgi:hypothetical protein
MQRIIVFSLVISLILQGCKKDDLKLPTDVSFKMDINRNLSNTGHLVFNSGSILLAAFDIEGTRQEGDPISFGKSFPQGLSVSFSPTNNISDLFFNIPQGVYTDLDISFETFDDNGDITILVEGQYTNQSNITFPLRFECLSSEYFSINGESGSGSSTIVLNKDTPVTSFVKFDPIYWFGTISNNKFNNADLVNIGGQMTILINESNNSDIYDIVVDRIDETTSAIFN